MFDEDKMFMEITKLTSWAGILGAYRPKILDSIWSEHYDISWEL